MIRFTVATSPEDYELSEALLEVNGFIGRKMDFPTVMAFENDELVALIPTDLSGNMVVAGPAVVKPGARHVLISVKLAEFYEDTLRSFGIKSYIVPTEAGSTVARSIERYTPHITPYAKEGNTLFFVMPLDKDEAHGRQQRQRTGSKRGRAGIAASAGGNAEAAKGNS